jgi:RimJ/RimL family protein N-acetyltransferase
MALREFHRSDNPIISSWFRDLEMQRWLESPWTESELDEMEKEENGKVFVIENNEKVVALIGCYLPDGDFKEYVISVVAVDPDERGKGYGKMAVAALLNKYGAEKRWLSYCDPENIAAHNFLTSLGWKVEGQKPVLENMITFRMDI